MKVICFQLKSLSYNNVNAQIFKKLKEKVETANLTLQETISNASHVK